MTLAVLIPTFRRNESLRRALESVFAQTLTPDRIVVADNSPEGGARDVVMSLQAHAPCPLVYVHATTPGVASARNAGFAACEGMRQIAQLDDDESAAPGWLAALAAIASKTGASVAFGPVEPHAEDSGAVRSAWLRRLYARQPELDDGLIEKPWGCGNSFVDLMMSPLPDPPFDPEADETGGEDDRLFSHLGRQGALFAWASEARVIEHVGPDRGAWRAMARRAFAFGQGPSQDAVQRKDWAALLVWMAIGIAQAVGFGALIAPARLLGPGACAACIDRAVQGAGKAMWCDQFAPRFYGAALVRRSS